MPGRIASFSACRGVQRLWTPRIFAAASTYHAQLRQLRQASTAATAAAVDHHDDQGPGPSSKRVVLDSSGADRQSLPSSFKGLEGATELAVPSFQLRRYQHDAIQSCVSAITQGYTRIGVSSPTGSGKTTMFMHLIPNIVSSFTEGIEKRGRTLVLVSSVELADQAEAAARRLLGSGWSVEVEQSRRMASGRADVTIATYQTLNNVDRLRKFDPRQFKLIIVDEAHHAAALSHPAYFHSYLRLLHYFNEDVELPSILSPITRLNHDHKVPIVGFSATFSRPDQLALSAVFEKIVFHREIKSMLQEGWLSPARSTSVKCDLDLKSVELNSQGDFSSNSLASHLNTPLINDLIVRAYLHRASLNKLIDAVDRRSTLIFCVDLSHVDSVTQAFRSAGIDARPISSVSHPKTRRETLTAFSAGVFPVLVNCEVLTEGADIPEIDCIILARPTRSQNLLVQMVGRGLRLSPGTGKTDCYIIDIVDNVPHSNGMLVSPTLWGLTHDDMDPERPRLLTMKEADDSGTMGDLEEDPESGEDRAELRKREEGAKVTFIDENDPFQLLGGSHQPIATMSKNAWVACGKGRFILELLDQGYILLSLSEPPDEAAYTITFRHKLPAIFGSASYYARIRKVAQADTLERAFQTGDKFAERKMGRKMYTKLSRYAVWRQRPPSLKALEMVLKMKGEAVRGKDGRLMEVKLLGRSIQIGKLTAGHVSAYLCAATHGASVSC